MKSTRICEEVLTIDFLWSSSSQAICFISAVRSLEESVVKSSLVLRFKPNLAGSNILLS